MLTLAQFYRRVGLRRHENSVTVFLRAISDEAGTDQCHDYVVAGGCVGTIQEWGLIEQKWENVLKRGKVDLFHAVEFHNKKGKFRQWSQIKRDRFYRSLSRIVERAQIITVTVAVEKKAHKAIKAKMQGVKKFKTDSDYGMAFRLFRHYVCKEIYKQSPTAKIDFIVENGPYLGDLAEIHSRVTSSVGANYGQVQYAEMLHSLLCLSKGELRGLEIADFIADRGLKKLKANDFLNSNGPNQLFLLANEESLQRWYEGMLKEKDKRRKFGSRSTEKFSD